MKTIKIEELEEILTYVRKYPDGVPTSSWGYFVWAAGESPEVPDLNLAVKLSSKLDSGFVP
jgi:hypothetical protein